MHGQKGKYTGPAPTPKEPSVDATTVPETWDWRWHNAVTAVKDQGSCGSCWTFGACSAIEGAHSIANNQLLTFSEQFFLDCVPGEMPYDCNGCNGGWAAQTYDWMITTGNNMVLEGNYKYA